MCVCGRNKKAAIDSSDTGSARETKAGKEKVSKAEKRQSGREMEAGRQSGREMEACMQGGNGGRQTGKA